MAPAYWPAQAPVPPPSDHRSPARVLQLNTLTLVTRLRWFDLCQGAVQLAQPAGPASLPARPGGALWNSARALKG
jgi:hypothetical protein